MRYIRAFFHIQNIVAPEHTFEMSKTVVTSSETTWSNAFGASLTASFSVGIPLIASMEVEASLSYDFKKGGAASKTESQTVTESFQVHQHIHRL